MVGDARSADRARVAKPEEIFGNLSKNFEA
jgi:hypothetical protein